MPALGSDIDSPAPERAPPGERRMPPFDLDALYREHARAVARWAAHLGGPRFEVDDLVHEIFLVARRKWPSFRGDAKVTTWLYGITERVVRTRRRSDRVRRWLASTRREDMARALAPSHLTPVDELERRQARDGVYRVLDRMAEKYRRVLVLFELEGISGEDIAALTGLKLATVWVHLHRARASFLAEMKRDAGRPA
jgi:RNA polymerase sigma-70 factor (ECF subfamily)